MERVFLVLQLKDGADVREYIRRHNPIPSNLDRELHEAGISDYTIALDEETGEMHGMLRVAQDWETTCALLADTEMFPAHAAWQQDMQKFLGIAISAEQGGQPVRRFGAWSFTWTDLAR